MGDISKDTISMAGVNILYNGSALERVTFTCFIFWLHSDSFGGDTLYYYHTLPPAIYDEYAQTISCIAVVPVKLLEPRAIPNFVSQA